MQGCLLFVAWGEEAIAWEALMRHYTLEVLESR